MAGERRTEEDIVAIPDHQRCLAALAITETGDAILWGFVGSVTINEDCSILANP